MAVTGNTNLPLDPQFMAELILNFLNVETMAEREVILSNVNKFISDGESLFVLDEYDAYKLLLFLIGTVFPQSIGLEDFLKYMMIIVGYEA